MPAAASRTIRKTMRSSRSSPTKASSPSASPTICSRKSPTGEKDDFLQLDADLEIQAGRRLLPPQRRRRDAGVLGGRLRGLPPAAPRYAAARWRATSKRWCASSPRTAGRGACTPPTTRRSARALDVFERVNQDIPLDGPATGSSIMPRPSPSSRSTALRRSAAASPCSTAWPIRANTLSNATGSGAAEATPPVARMLEKGVKVSAGTDATRVASYNPWVSLAWLVTGRTVGGLRIYPQRNCLDRETALRMWTENVTWFSNEEGKKGRIEVGQLADLIVPDRDYFSCARGRDRGHHLRPDDRRRQHRLRSRRLRRLWTTAAPPPAMPDWSPVRSFGGYAAWGDPSGAGQAAARRKLAMVCGCANACNVHGHQHATAWSKSPTVADLRSFWGCLVAPVGQCEAARRCPRAA